MARFVRLVGRVASPPKSNESAQAEADILSDGDASMMPSCFRSPRQAHIFELQTPGHDVKYDRTEERVRTFVTNKFTMISSSRGDMCAGVAPQQPPTRRACPRGNTIKGKRSQSRQGRQGRGQAKHVDVERQGCATSAVSLDTSRRTAGPGRQVEPTTSQAKDSVGGRGGAFGSQPTPMGGVWVIGIDAGNPSTPIPPSDLLQMVTPRLECL